MMQNNKKKKNNLVVKLRKFYRDVQQNRILSEAKKKQFVQKKVSKKDRRTAAIRKTRIKKIVRGY